MKSIFFLISLFLSNCCLGQIKIDTDIVKKYDLAFRELPDSIKTKEQNEARIAIEKEGNLGSVIFSSYKIDTLNKDELVPGSHFEYESMGLAFSTKDLTNKSLFCMGYIDGDTLKINLPIFPPPFLLPDIYQKVVNNSASATLEYVYADTVLRLNLKQPKADNLKIHVSIITYSLSSPNFLIGQTLYGEAEIISDPYYIDNGGFKTGYIHQRLRCKCVFKFPILKNPFVK